MPDGIDPIFVSVKEAARLLGISTWSAYQLCYEEKLECRFRGRRRMVVVQSLYDYADNLPTQAPAPEAS